MMKQKNQMKQKKLKIYLLVIIMFLFSGCDIKYSVSFSKEGLIDDNVSVNNAVIKANNELMLSPVNLLFQNNFYNVNYPSSSSFIAKQQWKDINEYFEYSLIPRSFSSLVEFNKNGSKINISFVYSDALKEKISLYGSIESLTVSLYIPYYVSSHNATSVSGSTYTWVIDDIENAYIEINFDMEKDKNHKQNIFSICTIVIVLVIIVATIIYFVHKNKKNNEI